MSESNNGSSSSPKPAGRPRRRFFSGLALGGLLGALAGGAASAWSHADGPGGWHGRGWCHHAGPLDPAAERQRIAAATDRMLGRIEATPEQREQVKSIVAGVLEDLAPLRDQHRQHRDAFLTALAQPSVDGATLDQLRRAELELADRASGRVVAGLTEVSAVLTPEQRGKLLEMAERFKR